MRVGPRHLLLVSLVAAIALAAALPASASQQFKPDAPLIAKLRAVLVSGRPAAGAQVWVYPDVTPKHRKAILHASWYTTADVRGRFAIRSEFRSHVVRAAVSNGNWVNFMILVATPRRFGVWEIPAQWANGRWHVDRFSLPHGGIVLGWPVTPLHGHH